MDCSEQLSTVLMTGLGAWWATHRGVSLGPLVCRGLFMHHCCEWCHWFVILSIGSPKQEWGNSPREQKACVRHNSRQSPASTKQLWKVVWTLAWASQKMTDLFLFLTLTSTPYSYPCFFNISSDLVKRAAKIRNKCFLGQTKTSRKHQSSSTELWFLAKLVMAVGCQWHPGQFSWINSSVLKTSPCPAPMWQMKKWTPGEVKGLI
jgi:hypothetical protein